MRNFFGTLLFSMSVRNFEREMTGTAHGDSGKKKDTSLKKTHHALCHFFEREIFDAYVDEVRYV